MGTLGPTEVHTYEAPLNHPRTKPIQYVIGERGCWECVSHGKDKDGYTRLNRQGRDTRLHRFVYELEHGPVDPSLVLLHLCDNRKCFNPAHLTPGTHEENQLDKIQKGRQGRGETNGGAKLTEDAVRAMRSEPGTFSEKARRYGVHPSTVRDIIHRRKWAHVQ